MKKLLLSIIVIGATFIGASAQAQFAKPEDAIKYRKAALTVMGAHTHRALALWRKDAFHLMQKLPPKMQKSLLTWPNYLGLHL